MSAHDAGIYALDTVTQHYAWGSHSALAELAGRPSPTARPEAECWIGAHPQGPSRVRAPGHEDHGRTIGELIERDPAFMLGPAVFARFGPRLPMLLKLLAAERPLSLQTHPTSAQAAAGFAREEALGIARDAPDRSYRDASHKPELFCALTPVSALYGFRAVDELLLEVLPALDSLLYRDHLLPLRAGREQAFAAQLRFLLETPREKVAEISAQLVPQAERLAAGAGPYASLGAWLVRIHGCYGDDPGLLVVPLMNLVELAPGEALYLPAGNLHAYLRGSGVELMASSDNVLRGGLTPKHVDVDELLRVLDFNTERPAVAPTSGTPIERRYDTPADEFALSRIALREDGTLVHPAVQGPELLVCTQGACVVRGQGQHGARIVELSAGESAFVAHGAAKYSLALRHGHEQGVVYRARVPAAAAGSVSP